MPPVPTEAGGLIAKPLRLCQLVLRPLAFPFVARFDRSRKTLSTARDGFLDFARNERFKGGVMRIALFEPDIAGNVGAVMRLGACLATPIDLIEPLGFAWDDRRVARAAMDYIDHVSVTRHRDWDGFEQQAAGRIVLLTTKGAIPLHDMAFRPDDVLLFGSEGSGVPDPVHARADARVVIPMAAGPRSLNLAVSAGIVLAEALRQTGGWPQSG